MLSYVDWYRPPVFVMENVFGILHFPLGGKKKGYRIVDGKPQGVIMLIFRVLTALGSVHPQILSILLRQTVDLHSDGFCYYNTRYQVHIALLHAPHYGSPQDRRRVIIMASLPGVPLPKFPVPTHVFVPRAHKFSLCYNQVLHTVTRAHESQDHYYGAPLRSVRLGEAISDLVSTIIFCIRRNLWPAAK